jgi:hypothetical protein
MVFLPLLSEVNLTRCTQSTHAPDRGQAKQQADAFRAHIPKRSSRGTSYPVGGIRQGNPFAYSFNPQGRR